MREGEREKGKDKIVKGTVLIKTVVYMYMYICTCAVPPSLPPSHLPSPSLPPSPAQPSPAGHPSASASAALA